MSWCFFFTYLLNSGSEFFKSFESNDADFISYYIHKNVGVQSQPNIPEIDGNTYSGPEWYERFPGDGDQVDTDSDLFGSFFPIVRFSNESLKYLVDIINKDIHGWHEGFVPTVLNQEGFKLDTIFNNQSRSDHFDVDKIHIKHKGIKVEWSWI